MSCMIQKKENVAIIAAFISRLLNHGYNSFGFEADICVFDAFKDCQNAGFYNDHMIYDKLYETNYKAYNKRYPDEMGLSWEDYKETESFKYALNDLWKPRLVENNTDVPQEWHYKVLKCVQFLMYQVSDIDDMENPVYKALVSLEAKIAMFIIINSSIYKNIDWE